MRRRFGVGDGEFGVGQEGQPDLSRGASSMSAGAGSATLSIESISPFAWCAGTPFEPPTSGASGADERHRCEPPSRLREVYVEACTSLGVFARLLSRAMDRDVVGAVTRLLGGRSHVDAAATAAALICSRVIGATATMAAG